MSGRASWRAALSLCAVPMALLSCATESSLAEPQAPATPPVASARACSLIEASLTRRPIRTLPSYTKMALVKLLPDVAPSIADDVDAVLDDASFYQAVARRVDDALSPAEQQRTLDALTQPEVALAVSVLVGEAVPSFRPPAGGATREQRELLFEAAMPPGRGSAIAQLPLEIAVRAGRAALSPSDPRQRDLERFARELPTLPRLEERDAFVRALEAMRPQEIDAAVACFRDGPCAAAHTVLHDAHLAEARQRAAALELRLTERARPSHDRERAP